MDYGFAIKVCDFMTWQRNKNQRLMRVKMAGRWDKEVQSRWQGAGIKKFSQSGKITETDNSIGAESKLRSKAQKTWRGFREGGF